MNPRIFCSFVLAGVGICAPFTRVAQAQVPPNPLSFVSQLDLECHSASGLPPAGNVFLRQLNPVLQGQLPDQVAVLGELEDVCVPVAKNQQIPAANALPFIRWVDLACYKASAPPVDVEVELSHLNPVLAGLPNETVKLVGLEQLCVPVSKKALGLPPEVPPPAEPPPAVLDLVSHVDVACYRLEEATSAAELPLTLSHLNPVIRDMELPDRQVRMKRARQLCVPVGKDDQRIPDGVRSLVEWVDFFKYRILPLNAAAQPAYEAPIPLRLTHLNPLFGHVAPFNTVLTGELKLLVPVAKNGVMPPD